MDHGINRKVFEIQETSWSATKSLTTNGIFVRLLNSSASSHTRTFLAFFIVTSIGGPGETWTLHFRFLLGMRGFRPLGAASFFADSGGCNFPEEDSCRCCCPLVERVGASPAPDCGAGLPPLVSTEDEDDCGVDVAG